VIYRFGNYELDDSARELLAEGQRVETEPKAFEMLVYLLQHRDRAVSKDELLNELWPDTIVSETALSRCVMKARRAVGDDSGVQDVIRTLHGHGYRFVAPLRDDAPDEPATAQPPAPVRERRGKPAIVVTAAVVVVAIAVGAFMQLQRAEPALAGEIAVLPVNNLIDDAEFSWVRVGLMSILKRMLEDGGLKVVPERAVLRAVGDSSTTAPLDESLFGRLQTHTGSAAVLQTTLESRGGLQRLSAVITHPDGRKTRRVIVGESPATLAAEMATVIIGLSASSEEQEYGRFAKVSTDPFVNEMYARALDLELQGKLEEARQLFRVAADQEPELFWLRYEIALCTRDLREWDEAASMFEALHAEASSGQDARALVATLNSHGVMLFKLNEFEAAEELLRRALDAAAERVHANDRATAHTNLALIGTRRGNLDMAQEQYDAAMAATRETGREPTPFFYNNYAGLKLELGDLETAQQYSERAVEGFRLRGQRRFEAPSLNRLAKILRQRGDMDGAIAKHNQALSIYRDLGDDGGEISVMSALGIVYRQKGDLTRARLNAEDVISRAEQSDDAFLLGDSHMQMAYIEHRFGHYDNAIAEFEAALAVFEAVPEDTGMRAAKLGIALAALEIDDVQRAHAIAEDLRYSAIMSNNPGAEARATWLLGEVLARGPDVEMTETYFRQALDYARVSGDQTMLARAGGSLAGWFLGRGDVDQADALVEEIRPHAASQQEFQRLDARLALASGDKTRAADIMTSLRAAAGESWKPEDEALLREASAAGTL